MRIAIIVALAAGAVVSACTLLEDDLPDATCTTNDECFKGERCNMDAHTCEPMPDAGTP